MTARAPPSPAPLLPDLGQSPTQFLRRYWQREAALIRAAMPTLGDIVSLKELQRLAQRDDVDARLVLRENKRWSLSHGPFKARDFARLPPRRWTLLVQGVNLYVDAADRLLRQFRFVPYARVDDLMVSYAAPGGGVGPHVDSYDVFLLQGAGRRRWRISRQADLDFKADLPLKILRRFRPEQQWTLARGDMLYLPPHYAHEGVALDACTTYSIGFRTPTAQELTQALLSHLQDSIQLTGVYADPSIAFSHHPAKIPAPLSRRARAMVRAVRWNDATVDLVVGCFLTAPKAQVFFEPPRPALSQRAFASRLHRAGVQLDKRSRLLYDRRHLFMNGETYAWPTADTGLTRQLANDRKLPAVNNVADDVMKLWHCWYRHGYLKIKATR